MCSLAEVHVISFTISRQASVFEPRETRSPAGLSLNLGL